eukprot:1159226-Pelagomonas_calceolata.AAC.1
MEGGADFGYECPARIARLPRSKIHPVNCPDPMHVPVMMTCKSLGDELTTLWRLFSEVIGRGRRSVTSLAYGWEHASELVGKEPSEGPSDAAKEGGLSAHVHSLLLLRQLRHSLALDWHLFTCMLGMLGEACLLGGYSSGGTSASCCSCFLSFASQAYHTKWILERA